MKKIICLLLVSLLLVVITSCDLLNTHIHVYREIETEKGLVKAPTCETYGEYKTICTCGKLGESIFKGNTLMSHDYEYVQESNNYETDITTIEHYHCKVCNKDFDLDKNVITTIEKPIEHVYGEFHQEVLPTCLESGNVGYYQCSDCNRYYDENKKEINDIVIPATDHSWGEYIQEDGKHKRICQNDENHIEEELCTFSPWETVVEATLLTKGLRKRHCIKCGYEKEEVVKELHTHTYYEEWTIDVEPKCETAGLKSHHCMIIGCTDVIDETVIEPLQHNYSDWKIVQEPKCVEDGLKEKTCSRCLKKEVEEIPATNHSYVGVVTPPSCVEQGYTTNTCSKCNDVYISDYTNALNHTYTSVVTDPTCVNQGYTTFTCSRCKDEYVSEYTNALEHKLEDVPELQATCQQAGYYAYQQCSRCEYNTKQIMPIKDHDYSVKLANEEHFSTSATCTSLALYYYSCSMCKKNGTTTFEDGNYAPHTTSETVSEDYLKTSATCSSLAEYYKSCSVCKLKLEETFESGDLLPHEYVEFVSNKFKKSSATCIYKETYYKSCKNCFHQGEETFEVGELASHTPSETINNKYLKTAATCTTKATYNKSCSVCGLKLDDTFVDGNLLPHEYIDQVSNEYKKTDATCSSKAIYYKSCKNCLVKGTNTFETGSLLPHDYQNVVDNAYLKTAATCTSKAIYYKSCSVCHDLSSNTFETGNLLPHDYQNVVDNAYLKTAATCTSKAVYYRSCSVCHDLSSNTFENGTMLSHKYIENHDSKYQISAPTCLNMGVYIESCEYCGQNGTNNFNYGQALGHNIAHANAQAATPEADGWNAYEYCTRCTYSTKVIVTYGSHNFVQIIDQTTASDGLGYRVDKCTTCDAFNVYDESNNNISKDLLQYSKLFGYKEFENYANTERLQKNYLAIMGKMMRVLVSNVNFSGDGAVRVDFPTASGSVSETQAVYSTVDEDWPIFFFRTATTSSTTTYMKFFVDSDYQSSTNRTSAWNTCKTGLSTILTSANAYDTEFEKLTYVYNTIMNNIEYAYISGTTTPETKQIAHSIHGYFSDYNCVCEGYAKTLQLVLNMLGINTWYLTGKVDGGGHAWNYIQIDGKVYFADITWDDKTLRDYQYFLLGSDTVNQMTNRVLSGSTIDSGIYFVTTPPTLATSDYLEVAVYENDTYLGLYHSMSDVVSVIDDVTKDYTLYLYNKEKGTVLKTSVYLDLGLFPATAKSIKIVGYGSSGPDNCIIVKTSSPMAVDITLSNMYFKQETNVLYEPENYRTIDISSKHLTIEKSRGYMTFNISGTGTLTIKDALSGSTSTLWCTSLGSINCSNLEIFNSEFYVMNNMNVTNLYIDSTLNIYNAWSFLPLTSVTIVNLYAQSANTYIYCRANHFKPSINITNINISTNKLRMDIDFTSVSYMPNVTISGTIDNNLIYCICGQNGSQSLTSSSVYSGSLCVVSSAVWNNMLIYVYNITLSSYKHKMNYNTTTGAVTLK